MPTEAVTMSDIARQAGVSKNTVSLALRHSTRLPETTRARIQKIAQRLGYQKDPTVAHLTARLRTARTAKFKATLALLNANLDAQAFRRHPTVPTYVEGCRRRAAELGYGLDEFWLYDPELDADRLSAIFRNRDIRGGIIVGLLNENRLPARFSGFWERFPCVVLGVRTQSPTLSFTATDQYALALRAVEKALALGYRRPALVLDHVIDKLVDGRFSAGFYVAQQQIPAARRTRPFYLVNEARTRPELFHEWFEREKPDLILTLYHVVRRWLTALNCRIPEDVGLMQLEWRPDHPDWAGMDQHNDIVGEAAVEMIIGAIHSDAAGVPSFPRSTLIGPSWIDGGTILSQTA